ncbi:MAG: ATP phosphoribosyltransferase [Solirubrobacteraceae bacterium]
MSAPASLTIAVPRGALFAETLELLDRLGIETTEIRSNDRKLLFDDAGSLRSQGDGGGCRGAGGVVGSGGVGSGGLGSGGVARDGGPGPAIGIITMRPSDVPTYVEAGAADLGITGKDVLLEQAGRGGGDGGRDVYELLDLGYGVCTLVLATTAAVNDAGEHAAAETLRRLGVMRVATKYPRTALRHFEETGRQAEIVEVKGSVELAPLTGLAEAIVDLTATGTTLRENGLVVREEIVRCTARLIANPVAHKLKARAIDYLLALARDGR